MRICRFVAVGLATLAAATTAQAQGKYPSSPVKILIGFGAGGGTDLLGRLVASKLAERLGQPVVVENRPGGGGVIALGAAANAAPDGYTIALAPYGTLVINPAVYSKLPYDSQKSFVPLSIAVTYPFILTVKGDSPAKTIQDLVAQGKAAPDKANYGSSATVMRLLTEQFKTATGAPHEHIPVKSTAEALQGLLNGQFSMSFIDPGPLMGPLKAGRVRALASSGSTRFSQLPDVPTMAEVGLPGVVVDGFMGFVAPRATPAAIVSRLETELIAVTKDSDFREKLKVQGLDPAGTTSQEFAAVIERDLPRWKAVAKAANIKLD
jgi:tripartite-type tricarboxylate transporter receptor subunit TctC